MSGGQVSAHAVTVVTVTVKVQVTVLGGGGFFESVAVHVTVVVPTGKLEPDSGLQVTCTQLPVADGAG